MFLISTPAMIMAWLKLKRRNIAPVLDANAGHQHARDHQRSLRRCYDRHGEDPANIASRLVDPFAEKKTHWKTYAIIAIILACAFWG